MNIIVDANIIFSGILNTQGKIGDLLINSNGRILFIAPDFLRTEIRKYHSKIAKASKLSLEKVREAEFQIFKDVTFISEEQVSAESWKLAYDLVKDVDPKDLPYVAYAIEFGYQIWSGDKALIRGLKKRGFNDVLMTDQLLQLREKDS